MERSGNLIDGNDLPFTITIIPVFCQETGFTIYATFIKQALECLSVHTVTTRFVYDVAFRFQLDGEVTLIINGEQVAQKIYVKNPTNLYTLQAKAGKEYHIEILFCKSTNDSRAIRKANA